MPPPTGPIAAARRRLALAGLTACRCLARRLQHEPATHLEHAARRLPPPSPHRPRQRADRPRCLRGPKTGVHRPPPGDRHPALRAWIIAGRPGTSADPGSSGTRHARRQPSRGAGDPRPARRAPGSRGGMVEISTYAAPGDPLSLARAPDLRQAAGQGHVEVRPVARRRRRRRRVLRRLAESPLPQFRLRLSDADREPGRRSPRPRPAARRDAHRRRSGA